MKQITSNDLLNYFLLLEKIINNSYIKENRKLKKDNIYKQNNQYLESFGDNTIECDLSSPFCYFNNIINDITKFSEYKIFRLKQNTKKIDNYFLDKFKKDNLNNNDNENIIKNEIKEDSFDDVLIERMEHKCNEKKEIKKE